MLLLLLLRKSDNTLVARVLKKVVARGVRGFSFPAGEKTLNPQSTTEKM